MAELYKGMPGSPITYLVSDISAGQTTISVGDDSALPDGPNICTIGYGEDLETIIYGSKSNGVLQGVTRGIEGTPRAWQSGTEVARFFTAHDQDKIIEAIRENHGDIEHLKKSVIVESGSTPNGKYTLYGDGKLICQHTWTVEGLVDKTWGSLFYISSGDFTFPKEFIDPPTVKFSSEQYAFFFTSASITNKKVGSVDAYRPTQSRESRIYTFNYEASGYGEVPE